MCNTRKSKSLVLILLVILALNAAPALAAAREGERVRLAGTVTAIDLPGENFSVADRNNNTTKVFVNPATEFELERGRSFFGDDDIPFSDLRVGDWVKIKSYRISGELEASEVDVYRGD